MKNNLFINRKINLKRRFILLLLIIIFPGWIFAQSGIQITKTDITCHGEEDGTATVSTVTNGTPPFTYVWSNGGNGSTISGLAAGTYTVSVTDAHLCTGSNSIEIIDPPELSISVSGSATIPYCIQDGPPTITLTASASGGKPRYDFSWPGGSLTVSSSGNYPCNVTDANNCSKSASAHVTFIPILCSRDPNDIAGATGYEPGNWVSVNDILPYLIRFENDPEFATAPAQKVTVTLPFDDHVNPFSFKLSDFGFGSFIFTVPPNSIFYSDRLDCVDSLGVYVDILAGIDVNNNEAFWILESIDPLTGLPPTDALTGFLPVNDSITHVGEGFVNFTIEPKNNSQTGDSISEQASIVFDINEAIETNTWTNTIDALPPVSTATPAPTASPGTFEIVFLGNDDPGGSGINNYALYVSENGAAFSKYQEYTDSIISFVGQVGASYQFFSVATDNVGNQEAMKTMPDVWQDIDICSGECTTIAASGGVSYIWSNSETTPSINVCPVSTTTYAVTITFANNSTASDDITVTVMPVPLADAGPDKSLCPDDCTNLYATGGGTEGSYKWNTGDTDSNIYVCPIANTVYTVTITDINGCTASDDVIVSVNLCTRVSARTLLQGPYSGSGSMHKNLQGLLPNNQPFDRTPWNYGGNDSIDTIPANMVDWILIELRNSSDPSVIIAQQVAILLDDGNIANTDLAATVNFENVQAGDYYLSLHHRNHMPVMSANPITIPNETVYDFGDTLNFPPYGGGSQALIELEPGIYGMIGGDVNSNGVLKYSGPSNDRGFVLQRIFIESGSTNITTTINGYFDEDIDMNGIVKYSGPGNDPSLIIQNIVNLTGSASITTVFLTPVP